MGRRQHRFHGAPGRFEALADFVHRHYYKSVRYIADVAGGQGMLARLLSKRFNYDAEVIDPRGHRLRGVAGRPECFDPALADWYDLLIALHPDEALRSVAEAALVRPVVLVPCCNFWAEEKLGREELLAAIEAFYRAHRVRWRRQTFPFGGPHNVGLVSTI
jgi:hypothetical protein